MRVLGEPVVTAVREVAVVGGPDVAQRRLGKLRLQVDGCRPRSRAVEHHQGFPLPELVAAAVETRRGFPRTGHHQEVGEVRRKGDGEATSIGVTPGEEDC